MNLIEYSLAIFFGFYLLNYSYILNSFRERNFPRLHPDIAYALRCAFCSTFWITLVLYPLGKIFPFIAIPAYYILVAPVVNLFAIK